MNRSSGAKLARSEFRVSWFFLGTKRIFNCNCTFLHYVSNSDLAQGISSESSLTKHEVLHPEPLLGSLQSSGTAAV